MINNTQILRKVSTSGVGYSVAELDDVRHVFVAAMPRAGITFEEQARDALETVRTVIDEEGTWGSIVKQSVFLKNPAQRETCRKLIHDFYGEELPSTTYISQPPCEGREVAIEAWGVGRGLGEVQIERCSEQVVVTRHNDIAWIHCGNVKPDPQAGPSVYAQSNSAFETMRRLLAEQGVSYDRVIRTWLYLGDIVGPEGETQRYKVLNRARTDFYEGLHFQADRVPPGYNGSVYPASTGIGSEGRDVLMSCVALDSRRGDLTFIPLENPNQTAAFDYTARYSPKSPKFARAVAIPAGGYATTLVSGTASITDAESRHLGDVELQTHQTLDNIASLISEENFRQHGRPGFGGGLSDLALVRVYLKRQEDYLLARAVCESRLGEVPTIYAVADVCRPELLVEIEGIAFSQRGGISKARSFCV